MSEDYETTMVKISNEGGDHLDLWENRRNYKIRPGASQFVPYSVIVACFGDPRSFDHNKHDDFRARELERMKVYWGLYHTGNVMTDFPKVVVTTLEGERVWTVIEDPTGVNATPDLPATEASNAAEATALMQKEIDRMQRQIEAMSSPATPTGEEEILDAEPEELPEAEPKIGLHAKVDLPAGNSIQ